jgi:molecular chaperone IbpA
MRGFDLTPYRRSTVGFDRLFDLIENNARLQQADNYPPSISNACPRTVIA